MSITHFIRLMRYAGCVTALTVALAAIGGVQAAAAQEVVRVGEAETLLSERVAQARQRAMSHTYRKSHAAMLGYEITVLAPQNEIWGMYSLEKSSLPTLAELIDGRRVEDPGSHARSESDQLVERRAAVLIRLDSDGQPVDVHLNTLDARAYFDAETLFWLGDATLEESLDLLVPYVDPEHDPDMRRGSVYAIARHNLPDRAMHVLTGLIRDTSEPDEIRKAAVYGLGMLRSEAARRTLLDLIYDESS